MTQALTDRFKPMLAGKFVPDKLRYPVYVQPKLDGIRACVVNGKLVSRTLKSIPNNHIRSLLEHRIFEGLDGELIVGSPTAKDCYRQTASGVMSEDKTPSFRYYVFDRWDMPGDTFQERYRALGQRVFPSSGCIELVPIQLADNADELAELEAQWVSTGHEGVILRGLGSKYKFGRGTAAAQDLLKVKRYSDTEAIVVGVYEEQHNGNVAVRNALGRTERSSDAGGKTGKGTLGGLVVQLVRDHDGFKAGTEFRVGTGFNAEERQRLWNAHQTDATAVVGYIAKVKHFSVGAKDRPRHPVFLGFRDAIDIGDPDA